MPTPRPDHLTWRHRVLVLAVAALLVAFTVRLGIVQIADHEQYAEEAARTHEGATTITAPRGAILDASGYPLATSVDTWDVYLDSFQWRDRDLARSAAEGLAAFFDLNANEVFAMGTERGTGDVVLKRQISYDRGLELRDLGLWGVRLIPSAQRVYPEGNLAGSLVGYVGRDASGLWGIESDFDHVLRGQDGIAVGERDPLGRPIAFGSRAVRDPLPGGEVQLTIDRFIQAIAERHLSAAVEEYHATGGSIIVMDPFTGAILAIASYPTIELAQVDLNDPDLADLVRNRAITDLYEPGSVFKTLTTAIAIDMGLVTPGTTYVDTGSVDVGDGRTIQNWDFSANGPVTVTEYLQKSLNTGSVWLSDLIGAGSFYDYIGRFGIGTPTHIGLAGEAEGMFRTPEDEGWYPVDLATNSYGQGLAATPLQMLTAVNAFANGGKLMRPYIVSQVIDRDGVRIFDPVMVRQVVTPETAETVGRLMYDVVEGVEWHGARVDGYHVAGKTGTTLVSIPTGYDLDSTIASFAGFLPYEAPRVSILVKIDQPSGGLNLGGQVAAPVFAGIAAEIMEYLNVPAQEDLVATP